MIYTCNFKFTNISHLLFLVFTVMEFRWSMLHMYIYKPVFQIVLVVVFTRFFDMHKKKAIKNKQSSLSLSERNNFYSYQKDVFKWSITCPKLIKFYT